MINGTILLFGGGGQVGQALRHTPLPEGLRFAAPAHAECDIGNPDDIARAMRGANPVLVVNSAAIANIEACEADPDLAMRVNFEAVALMAAHCTERSIPLIQISTDYVFDGADGDAPYKEDAPMNPLNVYGHSKMMGEEAARHGTPWHVILRTALVFGAFGKNILTRALRDIDNRDEIAAPADRIASPTDAAFLASGVVTVATALLNGKADGFGTFHLAGGPPASRYDFLQAAMAAYEPFTTRRPALVAARAADLPGVARPLYAALDCDKIRRVHGVAQHNWREGIGDAVRALAAGETA